MDPAPNTRQAPTPESWGHTPSPLGVYVHFPWCLNKCPYCDFLSIAVERGSIPHDAYADTVIAELERRAREIDVKRHVLASVFFGGGTPSLWAPRALSRVIDAIVARFAAAENGVEITVECNPSSFDLRHGRMLRAAGVNRVSIGVQSLDRTRLEFLGRLHDAEQGLRALNDALDAGLPRVSADLIFGVAGQLPEQAIAEAERVAQTGVTHLSAYALTIEPGTRFGALARAGRLPLAPETHVAESFEALDGVLELLDFEHYEISNYARSGNYALHNMGYWRGHSYLGLGCGAWGTVTVGGRRMRYRNTPSIDRYLASKDDWPTLDVLQPAAGNVVSDVEWIDAETALSERVLLGLRLAEGVDLKAAAAELGADAWPPARVRAAERLCVRKRLVRQGDRLIIPRSAWLFADATIAELM
jgi:oxygen-independent coproporphyrinogen-3 oxidase